MQTSYEIFLLVAKEKSITKAAQKAFISQQAVSEHIKKLEDKYGLKLFTRKPHFQLPEAGEAMFRSLQQMQLIERSMNDDLSQRSQETKGSFTLGINASRAQIILPLVMPEFARMYPHVDIHFSLQDTSYAEQQLLNGEVDLFLGIEPTFHQEFDYTPLCEDDLRVVASSGLLKQYASDLRKLDQHSTVDLKSLQGTPFIFSDITSSVNTLLTSHLNKERIEPWVRYYISDTSSQILMCIQGLGAAFVPIMLLSHVNRWNEIAGPNEYLHIFRINNLEEKLSIQSVRLKNRVYPAYVLEFEELMHKMLKENFKC